MPVRKLLERAPAAVLAYGVAVLMLSSAASAAAGQSDFDHTPFDAVLAAHVRGGNVTYASLAADRAALDAYVRSLAAVSAAEFDAWSRPERIAYLINAYNAAVLVGVVDHYPIRRSWRPRALVRPANSIWQIAGFFDGRRYRVAGRDLTLDDMEHDWLRQRLREPRIHFALVCAARSCPPLRAEAYEAERLDVQLDEQTRLFFNHAPANRFDPEAGVVRLSSILRWFGEDFEIYAPARGFAGTLAERGVLALAARFLPPPIAAWLSRGDYRIEYADYDWTLNDAGPR
jgi:hypothetical protein